MGCKAGPGELTGSFFRLRNQAFRSFAATTLQEFLDFIKVALSFCGTSRPCGLRIINADFSTLQFTESAELLPPSN